MENLSVRDLEVKGRRVLVREDFNVPTEEIDGNIRITDDTWIRESLSTIQLLRVKGAKVIALAHFGHLKGKPNLKYSLRPVADHLTKMIPPRASLRDSKLVTWAERLLRSTRSKLARLRPFSGTGPAGVFEIPDLATGSGELAEALAATGENIIGGGDSVTAVKQFGIAGKMTFISTGGGASLELLGKGIARSRSPYGSMIGIEKVNI